MKGVKMFTKCGMMKQHCKTMSYIQAMSIRIIKSVK